MNGATLEEVATASPEVEGLMVVPATIDLAGAEIELVSVVARESRLHKAILAHPSVGSAEEAGEERLDYVLIDCPPSLGLLTLNALVAGEEMLIPIQAEYYALEGLGQLLETVEMVRKHLNQRLSVSTILITMYDARTRLAAGVARRSGTLRERCSAPRSRARSGCRRRRVRSDGDDLRPGSSAALSYLEAAREIAVKGARRMNERRRRRPRAGTRGADPHRPPGGSTLPAAVPRSVAGVISTVARPTPPPRTSAARAQRDGSGPPRTAAAACHGGRRLLRRAPDRPDPARTPVQPREVFDEEAMAELVHSSARSACSSRSWSGAPATATSS